MRTLRPVLLSACLLRLISTSAQNIATDSKNKAVLPFLAARKSRVEFGSRDFILAFQGQITTWNYVRQRDSVLTARQNVSKKAFRFGQVQILNVADIFTSTSIGTLRPGVKVTVGYQRTVDEIKPHYTGWTYSFGMSVNVGVDNLKVYEPLDPNGNKVCPLLAGSDLNLTLFTPWRDLLIAFTGSYTHGYNTTELLNFKELAGAGLMTTGVAFDKFDGKFGTIRKGLNGGRASMGLPLLIGQYVAPVPYAAIVVLSGSSPTWYSGVFLNVFLDKMDFNKLNATNTFGVGVDWNNTGNDWSAPTWFVRGNLALGKAL